MEYKCIPAPAITIDKTQGNAQAASAYQDLLNQQAKEGWEYVGIDTITSVRSNGCLGALMGNAQTSTIVKVIIFGK